jgi:hypothetical protein
VPSTVPTCGRSQGGHVGPLPVGRGRRGSEHQLFCDVGGIPLAVTLTGGHRNDVTQLFPLVEAVPPIRGRRGRSRRRPRELVAVTLGEHVFERLRTRYERRADIHPRLFRLVCALICYRHLPVVLR